MMCRRAGFRVVVVNIEIAMLHPLFSHALLPNSYLFVSESAFKFSKILLEEVY